MLPFAIGCLGAQKPGDGHPVYVLPGFMTDDQSTTILRRYLVRLGYRALPWGFGRNLGPRGDLGQRMLDRVAELHALYGQPLTLVGQSLGGIYARQLARNLPDAVRNVVTLGSPLGAAQGGGTTPLVERLFEATSGGDVEALKDSPLFRNLMDPLPMPASALYSRFDGVASWRVCLQPENDIAENIEVFGSHSGMGFNPHVMAIVADRLAQPAGQWKKFSPSSLMRAPTPATLLRTMTAATT